MVIAIFRSRVAKQHVEEFERRYSEMSALVAAIPDTARTKGLPPPMAKMCW